MKVVVKILIPFFFLFFISDLEAQQRFPKPEFESGYEQPDPTTPEPRSAGMEWFDLVILAAVLGLASWLAIKKRSRRGIMWLSVFALIYFGFIRLGCVCPIGAVQNVTLGLFDPGYRISITILIFFLLPLVIALFYGRAFCGGACPLGAIQDLLVIKPVSVPSWVRKTLGFIPYLYLGLAILFAATATDFIICRYDPFIGIFRMDAPYLMIVIGISFLLLGMVFGRPYCRILCPYGVILSWMSRFSGKHLSITPENCINCRLCENSCPFDAIDYPVDEKLRTSENIRKNRKAFIISALLIPVWIAVFGFAMSKAHVFLSKAHPDVFLAELMIENPAVKDDPDNIDVQEFLKSGQSMDQLVQSASIVRSRFYKGSWILGGFLGLVVGVMIMNQYRVRTRKDYEPNRANCFSCGRCMEYCPVKKKTN